MNSQIRIQPVPVHAIVLGDFVILVDRRGRPLSTRQRLSELEGALDPSVPATWAWRLAARRMKSQFLSRCGNRQKSPWETKVSTLVASFRLRGRFRPAKARTRQRFERYATHTWEAASKRLWEQGHNRFRRHARGGWVRWAHTVSNNHNKKKGGRYANARYCDRQDDHGAD